LIDNAFKFTPAGGSITVQTKVEHNEAFLTITDTGSGIQQEDLPHVMEKFFKASSGKGGSGLGLAICKEIIELHGGSILLTSRQGSGTTVNIRLPLLERDKGKE
jgi:signal transduction histidine kinase